MSVTNYITIKEASDRWNISTRRISKLCEEGRIAGAEKRGGVWFLPPNAEKPKDARIKSGKYIAMRKNKESCMHVEI